MSYTDGSCIVKKAPGKNTSQISWTTSYYFCSVLCAPSYFLYHSIISLPAVTNYITKVFNFQFFLVRPTLQKYKSFLTVSKEVGDLWNRLYQHWRRQFCWSHVIDDTMVFLGLRSFLEPQTLWENLCRALWSLQTHGRPDIQEFQRCLADT